MGDESTVPGRETWMRRRRASLAALSPEGAAVALTRSLVRPKSGQSRLVPAAALAVPEAGLATVPGSVAAARVVDASPPPQPDKSATAQAAARVNRARIRPTVAAPLRRLPRRPLGGGGRRRALGGLGAQRPLQRRARWDGEAPAPSAAVPQQGQDRGAGVKR